MTSRGSDDGVGWTDGSGHVDGLCGSAWIAIVPWSELPLECVIAFTHGSVHRAETLALADMLRTTPRSWRRQEQGSLELCLTWYSDRQSLVDAIREHRDLPEESADLQAAIRLWSERGGLRIRLLPILMRRNSQPLQATCDERAGLARQWLKQLRLPPLK